MALHPAAATAASAAGFPHFFIPSFLPDHRTHRCYQNDSYHNICHELHLLWLQLIHYFCLFCLFYPSETFFYVPEGSAWFVARRNKNPGGPDGWAHAPPAPSAGTYIILRQLYTSSSSISSMSRTSSASKYSSVTGIARSSPRMISESVYR